MQLTAPASALLGLLAIGVSAGTVNKRAVEGVHLANCYIIDPVISPGVVGFSQMIYYADDTQAKNGHVPSSSNLCRVTQPNLNGWKTWEGSSISCTFPTNTYFTSNIQADAGGLSIRKYAGSGKNNYHKFNCFRDDNGVLYSDGTWTCRSIYFCRDA